MFTYGTHLHRGRNKTSIRLASGQLTVVNRLIDLLRVTRTF